SGRGNVPIINNIMTLDESPIAIFIGPEGGWSPNEISLFHKNGVQLECLGHQVLRTETAVVSAISLIVFGK
ncbi:MAG: RsmE family RNA methyltransferase, partial [Patescibacteria group bacterium]